MTVRHAALSLGAVLVLGLGVYLFVEVRSQAVPLATVHRESPVAAVPPAPASPPPQPAASPPPSTREVREPPPGAPAAREVHAPPPVPAPTAGSPVAAPAGDPPDADLSGPRLDAIMAEANKAYDRGDFDDAKAIAAKLLARFPTNVRMLRIMVSASCIDGDGATAQASYAKLPPGDQAQMRVRCARYGVAFADKQ